MMKLATFVEQNGKERTIEENVYINYCGDFSKFLMSMEVYELSEATTEEFNKVQFPCSYADPLSFCIGKFDPRFNDEDFELDEEATAHKLDQWFYGVRILNYFKI
jgi:hypothetical protein